MNNQKIPSVLVVFNNKISYLAGNPVLSLSILGIVSLIIRLYYFEPNLVLTLDSLHYFFYAFDIKVIGHLPPNYTPANNGWPIFLSGIFYILHFDDLLTYMQLQRIVSVVISVLTIIPVYLLCRKYFDKGYSIIGSAIFAFEPRLIQNSLLGVSDPLYILLSCTSITLFLSSKRELVYAAFGIVALSAIIRSEGLFVFFAMTVLFFIKYRKEKLSVLKYLIALSIFLLILTPMEVYRINSQGTDALFMRIIDTISHHSKPPYETGNNSDTLFIFTGLVNFPKYLVWDLIPLFIIFIPFGVLSIFRKTDFKKIVIIISGFSMAVPAFYAYSIPIQETRYLYYLYPLFCVVSLYTITKFSSRISCRSITLLLIVIALFFASTLFLENKLMDVKHQKESVLVAQQLVKSPKVINGYYPESSYLDGTEFIQRWPEMKSYFFLKREPGVATIDLIPKTVKTISVDKFKTLKEFISYSKEKGLTHIIVDERNDRPQFLKDVFMHDVDYPYLIKEYDSKDFGFEYRVKMYKINYDLFKN